MTGQARPFADSAIDACSVFIHGRKRLPFGRGAVSCGGLRRSIAPRSYSRLVQLKWSALRFGAKEWPWNLVGIS